jgi:tRNA A-37 threonylcarbamoyl transferase component Bud32
MPPYKMPDVIVLLPGITGSVLKKDGKVVWGYSASTIAKALSTLGGSIERDLALPHDDPVVDDLGDGIVADALMPDLHLLPGIWKIDGYSKIADAIKANFEVTEGKNFFPYPYDWRRDNRVSARRLAKNAHDWLSAWRQASGNANAKLILVGHSMGGLVSRYFLECLEGWKITKALMTFGTPYRGSLNALGGLSSGLKKGPLNLSSLVRQLTAMYQLLPIFRCYDAGNGELARVGETTGIPNVDPVKAAAALDFHGEIETSVESNQKLSKYQSNGYRIYPVVGVVQETNLSARLVGGKVEVLRTYKGEALGGDGTVPRVSAIPIELSENPINAMYAATQHGSLQNADPVIVDLIGVLSGFGIELGEFRKPKVQVALEVEDIYFAGEPITVRARPTKAGVKLSATLLRSGKNPAVAVAEMNPTADDWLSAEFAPPDPGAYRVTLGGADVETAEDSLVVTGDREDADTSRKHRPIISFDKGDLELGPMRGIECDELGTKEPLASGEQAPAVPVTPPRRPAEATPPAKARFGNFEVMNDPEGHPLLLGKGTFGRTYQARHCYLDTIVAFKITERYVADAAVRQRFLTEARGVAKLSHPHIARLYDFGEMDRVLHYAMEYCGGGSLADYVAKNGPVSLRRTIEIAQQIAGALKCAHTAGFIHRDLKPSNIMLTAPDGPPFAKLIDFGLVQPSVPGATRSFGDDQSADGARFLGTPLFASPEQLREEPMDVRTDLFSLGMTLWFLMAGGAPESGSSAEIAASRLNRESYAARLPANLPPPFRDVLARLLEKDRKNRFATAADVFKALNACAAALGFRRARDYTDPAAALEWEDAEATESGALDFTKLEPAELEPVVHRVPGHSSAGFT